MSAINQDSSTDGDEATTDHTDNLVLGVIRIPQDRTRLILNILVFVLILLYFPGSMLLEAIDFEVYAGWTLLALWIMFIGPALLTLVFLYNAHHRIGIDVALTTTPEAEAEGAESESPATGGD